MALSLKWDLTDFYKSTKDKKIDADLKAYKTKVIAFAKNYKGKIAKLNAKTFNEAIKKYEDISSIANTMGIYAYLNVSTQFNNKEALSFYQNIEEKLTEFGKPLLFFSLEINALDDKKFETISKGSFYLPWLKKVRSFKDYELSEELEEILLLKSTPAHSNWVRLYDETSSKLKYTVDGKEYSDAEISRLFMDQDAGVRQRAGSEFAKVSKENNSLFSLIYNTLIKDKAISDDKRGFKSPVASENLTNQVDDKVVENLANTVREKYKTTSHKYYKIKAKLMGVKKLGYWDRNAPLPFAKDTQMEYKDAVPMVLNAYEKFSPKLREIAEPFFENSWIDVMPKDGKRSGAYAMPWIKHPYLFLNWTGKRRDALTLAHELGHGCHMRLSAKQGELQDAAPMVLAEVASVFGEMLTFQYMLEHTTNREEKICLLAGKIEDMLNTAIRQIAYHFFETRCHDLRKTSEISEETFENIWAEEIKASLGSGVEFPKECGATWSYISHFYHRAFYVYAYSFADCLVNSLYQAYQSGKVKDFEDKYLNMLSLAGTQSYDELVKPFGLKAKSKEFWAMGLGLIEKYIDELEKLV
ncbi:MAG: M3 family oligoendopeptidase [Alphaproteobacteria bacterium]